MTAKDKEQEYMRIYREKGILEADLFADQVDIIPEETPGVSVPEHLKGSPSPVAEATPVSSLGEILSSSDAVPDVTASPDGTPGANLGDSIARIIKRSPVKQEIPSVDSLQELIQPKTFVFGRYHVSEWQEDFLTLVSEKIQGRISSSIKALRPEHLNDVSVRIDCSEIAGDDKKKALAQVEKLLSQRFEFHWMHSDVPEGTKGIVTKGVLFTTFHNYVGTSYVDIVINNWALPFFLYIGKGSGGSRYQKRTAMAIPGKYSKRLYKILSGYSDRGSFDYPIESLRKEFMIPPSYTNATIKRNIIDPSVRNINLFDEQMEVTAEFVSRQKTPEGAFHASRQPYDTVHFTITLRGQNPADTLPAEEEMMTYLHDTILPMLSPAVRHRLPGILQTWRNHGDLAFAFSKTRYYTNLAEKGTMPRDKARNSLLKALEEETHVKLRITRKKHVENID